MNPDRGGWGRGCTRTCIVKTVQHRSFPKVQFPEMHGLQGGAHRLARLPQALQGLALGHHQLPLARFVDDICHRGPSASFATRVAPAPGGAAPGGGTGTRNTRGGGTLHVPEAARWRRRQLVLLALGGRRRSSPPVAAALGQGWHRESDALARLHAHLSRPGCSGGGVPRPAAPSGQPQLGAAPRAPG